ncbi:MAG: hypothetical protein ACRD3V_24355 [Vicinamibacteria bacterium]
MAEALTPVVRAAEIAAATPRTSAERDSVIFDYQSAPYLNSGTSTLDRSVANRMEPGRLHGFRSGRARIFFGAVDLDAV